MADVKIISRETFGESRWSSPRNFQFAAGDVVAALAINELASAIHAMPVCFIKTSDTFHLVGLMGLEEQLNLFISPQGEWLAPYIPLAYTHYPFVLARLEDGSESLAVMDDEALVGKGETGQRFFDEAGKPSAEIQALFGRLTDHSRHLRYTQAATSAIARMELLEPWPLRVQTGDTTRKVGELYRISEAGLRALPAQGLQELRDCGALFVAYAQMLSMSQVHVLGALARNRAEASKPTWPSMPEGPGTHGIVSFENL